MTTPHTTNDSAQASAQTMPRVGTKWFGGPLTDLSRIGIPCCGFIVWGCLGIGVFGGFGHDRSSGERGKDSG